MAGFRVAPRAWGSVIMRPRTSNGLTTPHSQPAETYTPNAPSLHYPAGNGLCKQESTLIAQFALAGHVVRRGPCNDYMVCKFGHSQYCQDLIQLHAHAVRLEVCCA